MYPLWCQPVEILVFCFWKERLSLCICGYLLPGCLFSLLWSLLLLPRLQHFSTMKGFTLENLWSKEKLHGATLSKRKHITLIRSPSAIFLSAMESKRNKQKFRQMHTHTRSIGCCYFFLSLHTLSQSLPKVAEAFWHHEVLFCESLNCWSPENQI